MIIKKTKILVKKILSYFFVGLLSSDPLILIPIFRRHYLAKQLKNKASLSIQAKEGKPIICLFIDEFKDDDVGKKILSSAKKLAAQGCQVRIIATVQNGALELAALQKYNIEFTTLSSLYFNLKNEYLFTLAKNGIDPLLFQCIPQNNRDIIITLIHKLKQNPTDILQCYYHDPSMIGEWVALIAGIIVINNDKGDVNSYAEIKALLQPRLKTSYFNLTKLTDPFIHYRFFYKLFCYLALFGRFLGEELDRVFLAKYYDQKWVNNLIIKPRIKKVFRRIAGYQLNLVKPQSFNEKLQWLKLNNHQPLITQCADKFLVRDYVKKTIGEKYLIELLGVYDNVSDIKLNDLPHEFVLKVNWGSGSNIICKNKAELNWTAAQHDLYNWLKPTSNQCFIFYEWCYRNIKPKITCEKYLSQPDNDLFDYKFLCFNGEPKYIWVDLNRFSDHHRNFYTLDWQFLPNFKQHYPNDPTHNVPKPKKLQEMISIVRKLAQPFAHVRVDLYYIDEQIYFGELTFYSGGGMHAFQPLDLEYELGKMLDLDYEKKRSL